MKVHFFTTNGESKTLNAICINEGDHGIYLYNASSPRSDFLIGYVPYDRLDYVEPDEASEE